MYSCGECGIEFAIPQITDVAFEHYCPHCASNHIGDLGEDLVERED